MESMRKEWLNPSLGEAFWVWNYPLVEQTNEPVADFNALSPVEPLSRKCVTDTLDEIGGGERCTGEVTLVVKDHR